MLDNDMDSHDDDEKSKACSTPQMQIELGCTIFNGPSRFFGGLNNFSKKTENIETKLNTKKNPNSR